MARSDLTYDVDPQITGEYIVNDPPPLDEFLPEEYCFFVIAQEPILALKVPHVFVYLRGCASKCRSSLCFLICLAHPVFVYLMDFQLPNDLQLVVPGHQDAVGRVLIWGFQGT